MLKKKINSKGRGSFGVQNFLTRKKSAWGGGGLRISDELKKCFFPSMMAPLNTKTLQECETALTSQYFVFLSFYEKVGKHVTLIKCLKGSQVSKVAFCVQNSKMAVILSTTTSNKDIFRDIFISPANIFYCIFVRLPYGNLFWDCHNFLTPRPEAGSLISSPFQHLFSQLFQFQKF